MTMSTYKVKGMTCGHCEQAVTTELKNIEGVTDVAVDLETGDVTVKYRPLAGRQPSGLLSTKPALNSSS